MANELTVDQSKELEKKTTDLITRARAIGGIKTIECYRDAIEIGRALRAMKNGIADFWKPLTEKAFAAHRALVQRRDEMLLPVDIAIEAVNVRISDFDREQARLAKDAAQAEADRQRKELEEKAIKKASQLEAAGDAKGAEKVIAKAANTPLPAVRVESTVPRIAGKSTRSSWKWKLIDASKLHPQFLIPDEKAINALVRSMGPRAIKAIGSGAIEIEEDFSVSIRA